MGALGLAALDVTVAGATLGAVVKHAEDHDAVRAAGLARLVGHGG